MRKNPEDNSEDKTEYRNWPHDLNKLQELGEELLKEWRNQDPHSPRDYPSVKWLEKNGYIHLRWVLGNKHDMGTPEFFILLTSADGNDKYEWGIEDIATIERANAYIDDRVECRDWALSTKRTNRSRLNNVLQRFKKDYGDDAMLALANDPSVKTEVYESFREIGKDLRRELISHESAYQYLRDSHRFFEWLNRSGRTKYDPMAGIEDEFRWERKSESTPLNAEQVAQLWIVAESDEERVMVIGYCVWGVRTKELPLVHVDQLKFDHKDPRIKFKEENRKNGKGEVSLLFGLDALAGHLDNLNNRSDWKGYLYPSEKEDRSHLHPEKARKKFKKLCRRADVTIDDKTATPKHGRSFYYNILAEAETDLLEMAGKIAEEQGATDPKSVRDYYLTKETRRDYTRVFFRNRIRAILPDDAYNGDSSDISYNTSLDKFY